MEKKELKEEIKKVLEIVNKWGECTSEGGIYWEIGFWGDKRGKDPEKEIAKEEWLKLLGFYGFRL